MDVLTRLRHSRVLVVGLAASLLVTVTSCLVWEPMPGSSSRFDHYVHVVERKLTCEFCHATAEVAAGAGMPTPELCAPCHDELDAERAPDDGIAMLFDESHRFVRSPVADLPDDVRFSHRAHVGAAGVACDACHGETGRSHRLGADASVGKDACMGCHADSGFSNDCAACHDRIDRNWAPPSHAPRWIEGHGPVVRFGDGSSSNRCELCHKRESDCQQCHQETAPRDHTNHWRRRGHGLTVSLDRARCDVCHRTDFCSRCHEVTEPMNHTAGFGGATARHCTQCHFPLQDNGCATCHRSTPSHDLATPLPPGHNAGANCRQCHGLSEPLPHPDGGHLCITCHR
ncbi:MAG: cytochrome c3 family protein [Planctomycetes bacterium]|nr:cytochrome c3 family protein [Planctomycetota bacterium]